jgi:hypothetical protein
MDASEFCHLGWLLPQWMLAEITLNYYNIHQKSIRPGKSRHHRINSPGHAQMSAVNAARQPTTGLQIII